MRRLSIVRGDGTGDGGSFARFARTSSVTYALNLEPKLRTLFAGIPALERVALVGKEAIGFKYQSELSCGRLFMGITGGWIVVDDKASNFMLPDTGLLLD